MGRNHFCWFSRSGDGIPDGWEVHYGLDPRNASDAILDSDSDGWDLDRDGYIIPDTSVATSSWGESFSNYEEYMIYYDEGVSVTPGLRSIDLSEDQNSFITYDQSTSPKLVDAFDELNDELLELILHLKKIQVEKLDTYFTSWDIIKTKDGYLMTTLRIPNPKGT